MFANNVAIIYAITIYKMIANNQVETVDDLMKYLESNYISETDNHVSMDKFDTIAVDNMSTSGPVAQHLVMNDSPHAEYVYLNDNILSTDTDSRRNYDVSYNLHVCLFMVNQELSTPFLEYMFIKTTENYVLPMAVIDNDKFKQIVQTNDDDEQITSELLAQCSVLLTDYVKLDDIVVDNIYRGYLEDNNQNVYAFFDGTTLMQNPQSKSVVDFALMTDILSGKLLGRPINNDCLMVFKSNSFIQDIKDQTRNVVPRPISVYSCSETSVGEYENIYYAEEETAPDRITVLLKPVIHAEYGSIFLFTSDPINAVYDQIQRFALFSTKDSSDDIYEEETETEEEEEAEAEEEEETEEEEEDEEEEEEETETEEEEAEAEEEEETETEEEEETEEETETESDEADDVDKVADDVDKVADDDDDDDVDDDEVLQYVENEIRYFGLYTIDLFTEI